MKPWRLQTRLIALVLIPSTLLVLGLSLTVVLSHFRSLESIQEQRGHILLAKYRFAFDQLRNITPGSLQTLAAAALEEPGLRSLTLVNARGQVLLQSGPRPHPLMAAQKPVLDQTQHRYDSRQSWLYVQPLASPVPDASGQLHPAWVMLEFSTDALDLSKYRALLLVCAASLATLALMTWLLLRLVHRWLAPIEVMTEALKQVDSEHLAHRLHSRARGDLFDLQVEINALLERLAADTEELKSSMLQASADLNESMEAMEVQNIELALARKEAVEGNRIKSEFLANISHEIRTPLNGIMGFAKLILKTQLTPRQIDYVKTILKSADSLLAIINDVLDLSKIEAGKLELDNSPLDIEEVIFDVMAMLAPLAEEKNLEQVALIYDDVPRYLMGDPLRLKQIITNLVNNAIKFTPSGDITVRCMLEDLAEHHATLRISVTDTGIGLSEAARADLFQAFHQGDPTTARRFGGTGLGLVISRHLVELMQGRIGYDSQEGQGSTFWFTLRAELDSYTHSGFYGDHLQGRRIIVAEAHAGTRAFLANSLDHWGAESCTVADTDALQAALRDGAPADALILNQSLPGLQNQPIRSQLDAFRRHLKGPIVLLVRSSDMAQEQANHRNEELIVLSKPVAPRELYAHLRQQFSHQAPSPAQLTLMPGLLTPLHVLVVDDNPANLKLVCTLLEDMQVRVSQAVDGAQAVASCQAQAFDLVFMDIQMPGMSGLDATRAIRAHEQDSHAPRRVPIVALTAHAMSNEKEALLQAGMVDYLTKPVQESQLAHMLAKWTGSNPLHPATLSAGAAGSRAQMLAHPGTPPRSGPVNWQEGLRLAAGKPDLARDMLLMLLNSLEQEKRNIEDAYRDDDCATLLAHVHYLHGATRYCGVPALRDAAQMLETDLKSMLLLQQQQQADGHATAARTRDCQAGVEHLLARIADLIHWREHNSLPA